MIITIDGPTASGKSTAAINLAHKLNFFYINSGLLFRGLAYVLLRHHHTLNSLFKTSSTDLQTALDELKYEYNPQLSEAKIIKKGLNEQEDITSLLKNPIIAQAASLLGTNPVARWVLLEKQRSLAQNQNVIVEGRDAGSVVFPHADIKFFLTASLAIRTQRWQHYQAVRDIQLSSQQAEAEVQARDKRDSQRADAPLTIPKDAIVIDNGALTSEQTMQILLFSVSQVFPQR